MSNRARSAASPSAGLQALGAGRRFLDAWAPLTLEVPGFIEYRLPTLARALGFHFQSSAEMPDWGDQGSPTLNGVGRGVDPELIYADLTSRVWHPVYELIDATRL